MGGFNRAFARPLAYAYPDAHTGADTSKSNYGSDWRS